MRARPRLAGNNRPLRAFKSSPDRAAASPDLPPFQPRARINRARACALAERNCGLIPETPENALRRVGRTGALIAQIGATRAGRKPALPPANGCRCTARQSFNFSSICKPPRARRTVQFASIVQAQRDLGDSDLLGNLGLCPCGQIERRHEAALLVAGAMWRAAIHSHGQGRCHRSNRLSCTKYQVPVDSS